MSHQPNSRGSFSSPAQELRVAFGWSEATLNAIHAFVKQSLNNVADEVKLERQRTTVKKAYDVLMKGCTGPIVYLARDWETKSKIQSLTWSGSPAEWRELKKQLHHCLRALILDMSLPDIRKDVTACLIKLNNVLTVRELKQESIDCLLTIDRKLCTAKPTTMSKRAWVIWNLAEFFKHKGNLSPEHRGKIAWTDLARFLGTYEGWQQLDGDGKDVKKAADRLQGAYKTIKSNTPRDVVIAQHLVQHKQHRPVSRQKIRHREAGKRFHYLIEGKNPK
jgi:hypothetical protein